MTQARTTVVVVSYNSGGILLDCLGSLRPDGAKLVIIDNASHDGSLEQAQRFFPDAQFVINQKNLGFARACNLGLARASTEFVLFLNPDTISIPGAIRAAERFMDENPKCVALGGLILNPNGSIQASLRRFPTYFNIFFGRRSILTRLFPYNPVSRRYLYLDLNYARPQRVEVICGAWFFARRQVLDSLSGFDEDFFLYAEDTDLCYRLKEHGWEVCYFPVPVCTHYMDRRRGNDRRLARWHHSLGMYKFYTKHYQPGPITAFILKLGLRIRKLFLLIGI